LTDARGAGFALSARLAAVAELVPAGAPCADIGTDHGALAAWLAASGRVPLAWAIDLREGPLVGARRRVAALGLFDRVPIRRAAGCEGLDAAVRTVILAGMGGPLMTRILAGAPDTVTRVVLQPNVGESPLRRWLAESGWAIAPEVSKDHALTFELAPDVALPAGSVILFTIEHQFADGTHNLGKFRLSLLQSPLPPAP
jgi:tRNA A22 N-methylase